MNNLSKKILLTASVLSLIIIVGIFYLNNGITSLLLNEPDNLIWQDDFEDGDLDGWTVVDDMPKNPSNWYVDEGYLIQDANTGKGRYLIGTHIVAGEPSWQNYFIKANIVYTDDDYIGMLFRYQDRDNYYRFILSSGRQLIRLDKRVAGVSYVLAEYTEKEWQYCKFTASIAALHDTLILYLNNEKIFEVQDSQFQRGKVGFMTCINNGSYFDKIEVYNKLDLTPVPCPLYIKRGPYLQSVLDNKAVIMWGTNYPAASCVEYGLSKKSQWRVSSADFKTIHEIEIDGLERETTYYYRVLSDTVVSEWYSFKTAVNKNTPFSFVLYGDNRTNFLKHTEIARAMQKHDFDFIINNGDVVQRGPRADWDVEFFNPLAPLLKSKPVYVAIGNHELNAQYFYDYFSFPAVEHENYYSFKYGSAYFIFIDNNKSDYPDESCFPSISPGSVQYKWLCSQLASADAQNSDWLFVTGHVPCYSVGVKRTFKSNITELAPLFARYNVDVYFAGHIHNYERGFSDGVYHVISGGGGGPLGERRRRDVKEIQVFEAKYHYCIVNISGKDLTFTAYDIQGNVIDQFKLDNSAAMKN